MDKLLVLFSLAFISFQINALNLSQGEEFQATWLSGEATVFCNSGRDHRYSVVRCGMSTLDPVEFDYIVSRDLDADSITLNYKDHRGKSRSKKVKYDSKKNRSHKRVNLWIRTLFQRPLLHLGKNEIRFTAFKNGEEIHSVERDIIVRNGGQRICAPRVYHSRNMNDCIGASICRRFFYDQRYCH